MATVCHSQSSPARAATPAACSAARAVRPASVRRDVAVARTNARATPTNSSPARWWVP
jgi:hypothetical protein